MKTTLKRIGAYLLDMMIVALITLLLRSTPINPYYDNYNETYDEYVERYTYYNDIHTDLDKYYEDKKFDNDEVNYFKNDYKEYEGIIVEGDITDDEYEKLYQTIEEKYNTEYKIYYYYLNKYSIYYNLIELVVLVLYFAVFQFIAKGQTFGKRLFKLQVVKSGDKELNIFKYLFRILILSNMIFTILDIILLLTLDKNIYFNMSSYVYLTSYLVEMVIAFMVAFKADGRGLHDLISGTKVIDLKTKVPEEIKKTDVKDAVIKSEKIRKKEGK